MREACRKDVELIPVNDIMMNDVTADIRKETDAWHILVTIFLEITQNKSDDKSQNIVVTSASTLHISQNEVISNISEIVLDTSKRYAKINVELTVPAVSATTLRELNHCQNLRHLSARFSKWRGFTYENELKSVPKRKSYFSFISFD